MTRASVKTFEIDWIETSRRRVAGRVDLAVGSHERDAEQVRVDLGERGDVVGVLAFVQVLVLRVGRIERALNVGGRWWSRLAGALSWAAGEIDAVKGRTTVTRHAAEPRKVDLHGFPPRCFEKWMCSFGMCGFPRAHVAPSGIEQPLEISHPHLGARLGRERGPQRVRTGRTS